MNQTRAISNYQFECWRCGLMRDSKLEVRCDWCSQEVCVSCALPQRPPRGRFACSRDCEWDLREEQAW